VTRPEPPFGGGTSISGKGHLVTRRAAEPVRRLVLGGIALALAVGVFAGVLCLLNLLITSGITRRLREHSAILSRLAAGGTGDPDGQGPELPRPGSVVAEFRTVSTHGVQLTRDTLPTNSVVGFFSPDCAPCREQLPLFVTYAADRPGESDRFFAVVAGNGDKVAEAVAQFGDSAHVVTGHAGTEISRAFSVGVYPTFVVLGANGAIRASFHRVAELSPDLPAAVAE
jgi:thiol-disulfide isomerase/thioredoxin